MFANELLEIFSNKSKKWKVPTGFEGKLVRASLLNRNLEREEDVRR